MESAKHKIEFEVEVDEHGRVQFSREIASEFHLHRGDKATVRIVGGVLSKELTARNVTDEEIETISSVQYEDREHVVRFLKSQGMLASDSAFRKRIQGTA
ncbi:MAG: hypothetical protein KGJ59_07200 [Bacteroidota bacterium]|nr:hypothetical protein [Bacteroidota bacterium]